MVVGNLRLVLFWALRYQGRGVDLADLFQEGVLGLMRAVELYDAGRGTRFSTYASWRIRSQMQAAVLVAERWSGTDPRFDVVVPAAEADESLDEAVVHASVLCELRQAIDGLDDLGRRVVALRFGLDGVGPLSLNDVARQLHLGSRRVREIEVEALQRLAEVLDAAPDRPALGTVRH
jgi:RNA polymerase primary sigma factor